MAVIKPFQGVMYNPAVAGNLEALITPPYDVIDRTAEAAFAARHRHNIVQLDLPKDPGGASTDDAGRHQAAATLLNEWLKQQILVRDATPALYPYDVEFSAPDGTRRTRKGLVCLVALTEFAEGVVKPHEETFSTVISDRLALTRACRAQFSQVFSVFSDPANRVFAELDENRGAVLAECEDPDGNNHRLWRINAPPVIESVQRLLADKTLYIADGHHRYSTALAYRRECGEPSGPAGQVMMYLCGAEDPGLTILPTHRLIAYPGSLSLQRFINDAKRFFRVEEIVNGSRESLLFEVLSRMDEARQDPHKRDTHVFGCYNAKEDRGVLLRLDAHRVELPATIPSSLLELDTMVLNELVLKGLLGLDQHRCEQENLIGYHSDVGVALDRAVKQNAFSDDSTPLLFLLNPATMKQVQAVSDAGLYMPHKSTYFYPKVMTGLVMNVFAEDGATTA